MLAAGKYEEVQQLTGRQFKGLYAEDELVCAALEMAGVADDDAVAVFEHSWDETTQQDDEEETDEQYDRRMFEAQRRTVKARGVSVYNMEEEYGMAVYKDGEARMGFYMSSRGNLWQAGLYVQDGRGAREYYAHNLGDIGGRVDNAGKWAEEYGTIDGDVARGWLLQANAVTDDGRVVTHVEYEPCKEFTEEEIKAGAEKVAAVVKQALESGDVQKMVALNEFYGMGEEGTKQ